MPVKPYRHSTFITELFSTVSNNAKELEKLEKN